MKLPGLGLLMRGLRTLYKVVTDRAELDAIWEKRKAQPYYQPLVVKGDVANNIHDLKPDNMEFILKEGDPVVRMTNGVKVTNAF